MIKIVLLILFYIFFPLLIIFLCRKITVLQKLGAIALAYGFGLILGSSGILPSGSESYKKALQARSTIPTAEMTQLISAGTISAEDEFVNQIGAVQNTVPIVIIPLAFPLLLFSLDIKKWLKYAKKGYISVLLALVSGIVMVTAGFFIWKNSIPESWKLAGMFEGIYTGATMNFVAIKMALNVDPNLFVIVSTYDIIIGAVLVAFFITVAPRLFRAILPEFNEGTEGTSDTEIVAQETENLEDFSGMLNRKTLVPLLKAVGISIIIFAIAGGLSLALPMIPQMVVVILTITTLGILASLVKKINSIEKTFQLGMYLIIIFSLVIASQADIKTMFGIGMLNLVLFITWCYFGSLVLHLILAKIFKVDADNFLITSAAFIFSPPFVPLVANALKNKSVIVTGITGGILGMILGNYFGIALGYFLKHF